jgi:hypothetical protein
MTATACGRMCTEIGITTGVDTRFGDTAGGGGTRFGGAICGKDGWIGVR